MDKLIFLKLGGSLITDKNRPHTARPEVILRLAEEIAQAMLQSPGQRLLLGHGSGSFGHVPASKYGTRMGVRSPEDWRGFAEVREEAAALNRLVMDALHCAGLAAIAISPSASLIAQDGKVVTWDTSPINAALRSGLIPVVHGDAVFDAVRGGTILSTEELFGYLARQLLPDRLLLAGLEPGVWEDFPSCTRIVPEITPASLGEYSRGLWDSAFTDVTGGMGSKVRHILALIEEIPGLEGMIFSAEEPGALLTALCGERLGTLLRR